LIHDEKISVTTLEVMLKQEAVPSILGLTENES
jgi:hypothetical protein